MNNSVIGLAILVAAFSPCAGSVPRGLTVSSVHAVDNHDQLELPIPRAAGADVLIGQQRAEALTAIIDPAGSAERPDRLLLRVDFRSGVDLREAAGRSLVIFLTSYFCNRPKDFAILSSPTVYSHGHAVRDNDLPTGPSSESEGDRGDYYFYLSVARKESLASVPPAHGFDLRVNPDDVCFYVTGSGAFGLKFKTDVALIPKSVIASALVDAPSIEPSSAH